MAFLYVQHNQPFLGQGEIVSNLVELKLEIPDKATVEEIYQSAKFVPVIHPYAIVVSQACDLEWDYKARSGGTSNDKRLSHFLFCALFTRDEITTRSSLKSDQWKRIRQNQDERYHHLESAKVKDTENTLPELTADFKITFSLPSDQVYWLLSSDQATRNGALPSPFFEDFMHRLYSFLGRVATPEQDAPSS